MRLVVEGWRFVPHSYAIVNQFQLLEMLQRSDLELYHTDAPYLNNWRPFKGLLSAEQETLLRQIPAPPTSASANADLRIYFPPNLSMASDRPLYVFGTTEWGKVRNLMLQEMGISSLQTTHANSNAVIITPSQWSRAGFIQSGADPNRVVVVPHGVDTDIYKPLSEGDRHQWRSQLGWTDSFVFLNIASPFFNKGIHTLFKAFAAVIQQYPHARLVLKWTNSIFASETTPHQIIDQVLSPSDAARVKERFRFISDSLSFEQVALLYQVSDAYVSPYLAEGFNLPVLEAIACGLPVICTQGGPTDEFTTPQFALAIASTLQTKVFEQEQLFVLQPNLEHLICLMKQAIAEPTFLTEARLEGPKFVANGFTWKHVVDRLLAVMSDREFS
jgi:glycosyltransferase involved in cell wall biosynthesis